MRYTWSSKLVALCLGVVTAFVPFSVATADDDERSHNDNAAIAINERDNREKFKLKYRANRVDPGEDDPDNVAWAQSSCEGCKTTAIAIQIALVEKPVDTDFSPQNLAFAINQECTDCETVALAHQIVREVETNVYLTSRGKDRIEDIIDDVRDLKDEDLTPPELDARVGAYVDEIKAVLDAELRPRQDGDDDDDDWDDRKMDAA